jgi:hypothetical protein
MTKTNPSVSVATDSFGDVTKSYLFPTYTKQEAIDYLWEAISCYQDIVGKERLDETMQIFIDSSAKSAKSDDEFAAREVTEKFTSYILNNCSIEAHKVIIATFTEELKEVRDLKEQIKSILDEIKETK